MNIEIIKSLKERAKEMLEDNYKRKIGDEETYNIICELEKFYTAYEKEKEKVDSRESFILYKEKEITKLKNEIYELKKKIYAINLLSNSEEE